jgi:DinB superfamily
VIDPDTKNWTWVLERPCPDCGFDASSCPPPSVPNLVRQNVSAWRALATAGAIRPGRPDDHTWSTLEYACHVRDVYRRFGTRIALMRTEDDPLFPNWDQDASAVEDAYETQDVTTVVDEMDAAAAALAAEVDALRADEWDRSGRRSDGATFTVATISRYMIHDPIHHLWDVSRQLS